MAISTNHVIRLRRSALQLTSGVMILALAATLSGCAAIFGTGLDIELTLPSNTMVTDVTTGEVLANQKSHASLRTIRLRKGPWYVLKVQRDSSTSYSVLEPRRNHLSALNSFNYNFGLVVDQLFHADLDYDQAYLDVDSRHLVDSSNQRKVEDSLLALVQPVHVGSIFDNRSYFVFSAWLTLGVEGPITQNPIAPPWGGVGIGLQVVPWVMPLFEHGYMAQIVTGDLYEVDASWSNIGVQVQEPVTGAFVAGRYGWMNVSGYSYRDAYQRKPKYDAKLDYYTISMGLNGQWGKIEYRYRRNISWESTPNAPDLSGSYNGLHVTFHIML